MNAVPPKLIDQWMAFYIVRSDRTKQPQGEESIEALQNRLEGNLGARNGR